MTVPLPVSIIVVSRHRPKALALCLTALPQQDHPMIEVVVVADPEGVAVADRVLGGHARTVAFDLPNISAARNAGLAVAAGAVVAFIDDDAVAEPSWASRLAAPFADPAVVAATGFVRGRNGFSHQWRAATLGRDGLDRPLAVPEDRVSLHQPPAGGAVKTQGTNCAFRAEALRAAGAFDPGFRFYLDEADVNLRMAARGGLTAVVPLAEVQHGFAESARRRADRVPTDLHDIGASVARFAARHGGGPAAVAAHRADQRGRLIRHMVAGRIEPRDVARLMAGFDAGLAEGAARPAFAADPLPPPTVAFQPLPGTGARPGVVLAGRSWQRRSLRARAEAAVADGAIVTVIRLSPTGLFHRLRYRAPGYWDQRGGLFGRSCRDDALFRPWRFGARIARETSAAARVRPVTGG